MARRGGGGGGRREAGCGARLTCGKRRAWLWGSLTVPHEHDGRQRQAVRIPPAASPAPPPAIKQPARLCAAHTRRGARRCGWAGGVGARLGAAGCNSMPCGMACRRQGIERSHAVVERGATHVSSHDTAYWSAVTSSSLRYRAHSPCIQRVLARGRGAPCCAAAPRRPHRCIAASLYARARARVPT